ncbi:MULTISPECIES: hypothetical protein, partial [Streptomyces]|uniref:hypothetical protein n=1 Tax=Streptomyces TaxID=1883 RepID=UPI00069A8F95
PKPAPTPVHPLPEHYAPVPRQPHAGHSTVTTTLLITTPAVLAAAALRPRSRSSSGSAGRRSP